MISLDKDDHLIRHTRDRLLSETGRLLVIQTAFLGDVILVTPLLRAVRKSFPRVKLSVLVIPECAGVLHGQVDEVITFDKRRSRNRRSRWFELVNRLRTKAFDAALIPHRSLRSGLTAYRAGIPCRIGFNRGAGARLHTGRIAYSRETYEGIRNLALLEPLGHFEDNGLPVLLPADEDIERAENLLSNAGLTDNEFAVMAPGSVWKSKRWPVASFRELRRQLEDNFALPVVTIGGGMDRDICSQVVSRPERDFSGRLSPLGSAAVLKNARLLVSGDTAPAHRTRQIIIFGSTTPRFGFAPPVAEAGFVQTRLWCRPCSDHGRNFCPNFGRYTCLTNITPEHVIEAARDWL